MTRGYVLHWRYKNIRKSNLDTFLKSPDSFPLYSETYRNFTEYSEKYDTYCYLYC